jgi:hypothetical protein
MRYLNLSRGKIAAVSLVVLQMLISVVPYTAYAGEALETASAPTHESSMTQNSEENKEEVKDNEVITDTVITDIDSSDEEITLEDVVTDNGQDENTSSDEAEEDLTTESDETEEATDESEEEAPVDSAETPTETSSSTSSSTDSNDESVDTEEVLPELGGVSATSFGPELSPVNVGGGAGATDCPSDQVCASFDFDGSNPLMAYGYDTNFSLTVDTFSESEMIQVGNVNDVEFMHGDGNYIGSTDMICGGLHVGVTATTGNAFYISVMQDIDISDGMGLNCTQAEAIAAYAAAGYIDFPLTSEFWTDAISLENATITSVTHVPNYHMLVEFEPEAVEIPENPGSITVCKVIVDGDGNVITDGSFPTGSFAVNSMDHPNSTVDFDASFNNSSVVDTDLFDFVAGLDTTCVDSGEIELGEYFYEEEVITSAGTWFPAMYNDQILTTVDDLGDFYYYSDELFDGDDTNDEDRNKNSDGHVVLTEANPNRTLVVLNQFVDLEEPECPADEEIYARIYIPVGYTAKLMDVDETPVVSGEWFPMTEGGVFYNEGPILSADENTIVISRNGDGLTVKVGPLGSHYSVVNTILATISFQNANFLGATVGSTGTMTVGFEFKLDDCEEVIDYCPFDFDKSGIIDNPDVNALGLALGSTDPDDIAIYDITGDSVIDQFDMSLLSTFMNYDGCATESCDINSLDISLEQTSVSFDRNNSFTNEEIRAMFGASTTVNAGVVTDTISGPYNSNGTYTVVFTLTDPQDPDCVKEVTGTITVTGGGGGGGNSCSTSEKYDFVFDAETLSLDIDNNLSDLSLYVQFGLRIYDAEGTEVTYTHTLNGPYNDEGNYEITFSIIDPEHDDCDTEEDANIVVEEDGEVLGEDTIGCEVLLTTYIKLGTNNDPTEVKELQEFLNEFMGTTLTVDGIYGKETFEAVKNFQFQEAEYVLEPWGILLPTGYVYQSTQTRINNINCGELDLEIPDLMCGFEPVYVDGVYVGLYELGESPHDTGDVISY